MVGKFKQEVCTANKNLVKYNLVILTWGNASAKTENDLVIIKPSGISYNKLTQDNMVVVDLEGNIVEGNYKPSSDTMTHLEIYKACPEIKGICHTHSTYATAFAQAGLSIEHLGTTHADYFYGAVPCTRNLTETEAKTDYEKNTGKVIIETFKNRNWMDIPACLVRSHGVFTWGNSALKAVENALVLEKIARMNHLALTLNPQAKLSNYILEKHYNRKHGINSYYGQC